MSENSTKRRGRTAFITCFTILLIITCVTILISRILAPENELSYLSSPAITLWEKLIYISVSYLIPIIIFIILFVITFNAKGIAEVIAAIILIFSLSFYYAEKLVIFTSGFITSTIPEIAIFPIIYQKFILDNIPEFQGFQLFGIRFLNYQVNEEFVPNVWPIIVLLLGIIVWSVLTKYVRNEKLKKVGREYWLFITTYIIVALIFSSVVNLSFARIMFFTFIVAFIFAAGLFRIGTDVGNLIVTSIRIVRKFIRIALMYIALISARIVKILRNLVKYIRDIYERYIVEPFRKLHRRITNFLDNIEKRVNELLDEEKLE